jgi:hypothetical protein
MSDTNPPLPTALLDSSTALEELERLVDRLATRIPALHSALAERSRRVAELERQLAVAEARLAVEKMHAEGLSAQAELLMSEGLAAAGEPADELDDDGTPKTRLALAYEAAFDAKGQELGIEDPARFRAG